MSDKGGRLSFTFDLQPKSAGPAQSRSSEGKPFRVLLMADLSGRAQRNVENAEDLGMRPCPRIDVDNFEDVMMTCAPCIHWPIGKVVFRELEDFHPDQLYHQLEVFKSLRDTRQKLNDPGTSEEVIKALRPEMPDPPPVSETRADESREANLLDSLLGRPSDAKGPSQVPSQAKDTLSSLIHQIVSPHIVKADPRIDEYTASVDAAISHQMGAVLHHRDFQALEAVWTGIWELVTGLETDNGFELCLLDVSKKELQDDLEAHKESLTGSGLYGQWVDKAAGAPDGRPWSVIAGCYTFDHNEDDMALLAGLGLLASHAQAPFLADAAPSLAGCPSFDKAPDPAEWTGEAPLWDELRKSPAAPWIGLACPRVLMRTPYGKSTEEIDAFEFEELSDLPDHGHFLWGSAALACVRLMGTAFQEQGWGMRLEGHLDLEDLPAYTLIVKGEKQLKPCAEAFLSERAGDELSRRGLIALMSFRHQNGVRVRNIQSIADPPAALAAQNGVKNGVRS